MKDMKMFQKMKNKSLLIIGKNILKSGKTFHAQPAFTCSKLTIETLEQGV